MQQYTLFLMHLAALLRQGTILGSQCLAPKRYGSLSHISSGCKHHSYDSSPSGSQKLVLTVDE